MNQSCYRSYLVIVLVFMFWLFLGAERAVAIRSAERCACSASSPEDNYSIAEALAKTDLVKELTGVEIGGTNRFRFGQEGTTEIIEAEVVRTEKYEATFGSMPLKIKYNVQERIERKNKSCEGKKEYCVLVTCPDNAIQEAILDLYRDIYGSLLDELNHLIDKGTDESLKQAIELIQKSKYRKFDRLFPKTPIDHRTGSTTAKFRTVREYFDYITYLMRYNAKKEFLDNVDESLGKVKLDYSHEGIDQSIKTVLEALSGMMVNIDYRLRDNEGFLHYGPGAPDEFLSMRSPKELKQYIEIQIFANQGTRFRKLRAEFFADRMKNPPSVVTNDEGIGLIRSTDVNIDSNKVSVNLHLDYFNAALKRFNDRLQEAKKYTWRSDELVAEEPYEYLIDQARYHLSNLNNIKFYIEQITKCHFDSKPGKMDVYLRGKKIGVTPFIYDKIQAGDYRIEMRDPDGNYEALAAVITFKGLDPFLDKRGWEQKGGKWSLKKSQSIIAGDRYELKWTLREAEKNLDYYLDSMLNPSDLSEMLKGQKLIVQEIVERETGAPTEFGSYLRNQVKAHLLKATSFEILDKEQEARARQTYFRGVRTRATARTFVNGDVTGSYKDKGEQVDIVINIYDADTGNLLYSTPNTLVPKKVFPEGLQYEPPINATQAKKMTQPLLQPTPQPTATEQATQEDTMLVNLTLLNDTGGFFHPGDTLNVSITTNKIAYVYLLNIDAKGIVHLLFPMPFGDQYENNLRDAWNSLIIDNITVTEENLGAEYIKAIASRLWLEPSMFDGRTIDELKQLLIKTAEEKGLSATDMAESSLAFTTGKRGRRL